MEAATFRQLEPPLDDSYLAFWADSAFFFAQTAFIFLLRALRSAADFGLRLRADFVCVTVDDFFVDSDFLRSQYASIAALFDFPLGAAFLPTTCCLRRFPALSSAISFSTLAFCFSSVSNANSRIRLSMGPFFLIVGNDRMRKIKVFQASDRGARGKPEKASLAFLH